MRFSVIIPAHNEEKNIHKALDSVKSQVFTDYEIIVCCDDCSDHTEEIAKEYGAITVRCNVHNDGRCRNYGLDVAQGEYILFLDADDWWLHEYVLTELDSLINGEDIICYAFIWRHIGYVPAVSPTGKWFSHVTNKVWRREFIGDNRFGQERISDTPFNNRMFERNPKVKVLDMPIYYYDYLRPGSDSFNLGRTVEGTKSYWGLK